MKSILSVCLLVISLSALAHGQQPTNVDQKTAPAETRQAQTVQLPQAPALLSPAICGKGVFLLSVGDEPLGRESFEFVCKPEGLYAASGSTNMKTGTGGTLTHETTIEVDREGAPLKFTLKGESNGAALDQTIVFRDEMALITSGGATREIAYKNKAALSSPSVSYLLQFVAARYDTARGGVQEIPLFPNLTAKMERAGRDEVTATSMTGGKPTAFDRYTLQIGPASVILWADMQGRVAIVTVLAQRFVIAREEYAPFVEPLRAALISKVRDVVPDYSAPVGAPFTAEEVRVPAKGFTLAGTLLLPKTGKRPFPAVVMMAGSGQQTRDSRLPGLEKYMPFRQIAEALASRGIAVLRADDRGVGDSGGFSTLTTATTFDFADDVRAQISYMRTRAEINPRRIAIIGHSEGGIIAPLVAVSDPNVAALVLMAATAKSGEEVLRYQLNNAYEKNPKLTEAERAKGRAETEDFLRVIKTNGDASKFPPLLQALNSSWGRAFLSYDPLPTIRKVRQPLLILQGALDRQVTAEQARMLEQAARAGGNRDVTMRVFDNLNHLFLPAKTGAPGEYASLATYTLEDELLTVIADWLKVRLRVGK